MGRSQTAVTTSGNSTVKALQQVYVVLYVHNDTDKGNVCVMLDPQVCLSGLDSHLIKFVKKLNVKYFVVDKLLDW